ncbi:YitT family protein [Heyndrickxia oleronia]|uniref:Membrane protein n=2 Tax=Heyndrickxia oleronia TaxID=38875 RepID=A0A8E2I5S0_9BACI|nr:YitT family protein [Heyndrickxia oleronia]MEC1376562.1 YitT family protein [Heyndrickxia oleronia]OOP67251.1 membrane protein [Heyndrickxia oleronia]QQZ06974.1 YitT family protein [Heyndrickxia oleronia]
MKNTLITYLGLLFGAAVQGIAMSLFLFPHSIPSGGAAGLALLLNHWFHLSLGFSLWLANAVFLLFALNYFGSAWTFRTIISVATTSATVTVLTSQNILPHIHILFDVLVGSIFFGIGVGILIRLGASSGGMVIPALMIASYKNWSPGKVMMGINLFIFLLTSLVIDYKIVIYAIICQFFSTNIIDFINEMKLPKGSSLSLNWRKR